MEGITLSPRPHLAWLGFGWQVPSDGVPLRFFGQSKSFRISIVLRGSHCARWIVHGREEQWRATAGTVHFVPASDELHTHVLSSDVGCELYEFLIPASQLYGVMRSEGRDSPVEWKHITAEDDRVLRQCMTRLAYAATAEPHNQCLGQEEEARRLVLRLVQLHGGEMPEWQHDGGVFDARTLAHVVEYIEAHLRCPPCLCEFAGLVGLSPTHFAKKFRRSAGLSICHFITLRRIQASLDLLKHDSLSLSHVAIDLGFSSQSHFTRLFSDVTGMTPARYRKQFGRTVA